MAWASSPVLDFDTAAGPGGAPMAPDLQRKTALDAGQIPEQWGA